MNEQTTVYLYTDTLQQLKKNTTICGNMEEPQNYKNKWKK